MTNSICRKKKRNENERKRNEKNQYVFSKKK